MQFCFRLNALPISVLCGLSLGFAQLPCTLAQGPQHATATQAGPARSAAAVAPAIPALMISDVHFDPFHDPGKVKQLVDSPVSQWRTILSEPESTNQEQAFAALQTSCHARGIDTPFALLRSSLDAMRAREPDAKFMTVSGDLIAHAFTCRYKTLVPDTHPGDYETFVLKTLSFVMGELRSTFPGMPIYVALGNNDTGCGDYKLDADSRFLAETGKILAEGLPKAGREQALKEFANTGSYSVAMAAPMQRTRMIVLNDVFLSAKYTTCGGKPDAAAAAAELSWLEHELAEARRMGQRVWVMGHIPPGIDAFSTVAKFRDVCAGKSPVEFLADDKMADLLAANADVMRLGIFAHTHMDEMRLLRTEGGDVAGGTSSVAVKLVPSISPVNGNTPSFTVAHVNPVDSALQNYAVFQASNQTGIGTAWTEEYDFRQTYHQEEFSAATVKALIGEFRADGGAKTAESQAYIANYFVGNPSRELTPFWPEYVCAQDNRTAKEFAACVCPAAK